MSLPTANSKVINSVNIVADETSEAIDLNFMKHFSLHIICDNTSGGNVTVRVQVSNDSKNWLGEGTEQVLASGQFMLKISDAYYRYARVFVDHNSGTVDDLVIIYNAKGI